MFHFKSVLGRNRKKSSIWLLEIAFLVLAAIIIVALVFLIRSLSSGRVAPVLPPPPADAPYRDSSLQTEVRIDDLVARMTLDEKIGQMALVEKNSIKNTADIAAYNIGAVLSGAGGKPDDNTPQGWKQMVSDYSDAALRSRLGIPILYGADANHGNGNVPGATIFPHAIGLGAANDPPLTEQVARATAEESAALGIRWNFSPALDLPADIRWGRVYEEFSDDPERAGTLGAAYITGLQDQPVPGGRIDVLATAKHYIGVGSLIWGTSMNKDFHIDQGVVPASEQALRNEYLGSFRAAINAGALSVMTGLGYWGGTNISADKYLLTDVLKNELGFKGFVVSDWYGVYEFSANNYKSLVASVNAGMDMVMLPYDYKSFVSDMRRAIASGDIKGARIDDAVRRILRAKFALGLFDEPQGSAPGIETVASAAHRELARHAVQESLVLLKNNGNILPIPANVEHIRVAGSAADNFGRQAGGWTVEWQGIDGNWIPGTTSILSGIRGAVSKQTLVEYDVNGNFPESGNADIGIAVVGEKPYAEGWGDNAKPRLDTADLSAIANLKKTCKQVVVVLVTGRPLIITDELPKWDAVVAAWLPGSEGEGVSDVLFGAAGFSGTLPLPWPRSVEQLPLNFDGKGADGTSPLFPRGYGLR
jgi:beta-glucosidase